MESPIKIPRTLSLLQNCWASAEGRVCKLISKRYLAHDEVFITRLFYGQLRERFTKKNRKSAFERSFAEDLRAIYSSKDFSSEVERVSRGIIARVSYHEPATERLSGADMGLAVVRPNVEFFFPDSPAWGGLAAASSALGARNWRLKHSLNKQGLLCQAKRQTSRRTWGKLTQNQKSVLPSHLEYTAFLFYGYSDVGRTRLKPFLWKTCGGISIQTVEQWLRRPKLKETFTSQDVLAALAAGDVGTADQEIIRTAICPEAIAHLKIEITWKQGYPPDTGPRDGGSGSEYLQHKKRSQISKMNQKSAARHLHSKKYSG